MPITDEESLRKWLEGRPREDAQAIASGAALRVFPLWGREMRQDWVPKRNVTSLPVLRRNLTSAMANRGPNLENRSAEAIKFAFADAVRTADAAGSYAARNARSALPERPARVARAASTARAVDVPDAAKVAADAARVAHAKDNRNVRNQASLDGAANIWFASSRDADLIANEGDPFTAPLWPDTPPDWFTTADTETRAIWAADPPGRWDFWLRWWDGVLAGKPLDWDLQRDVALIPHADWQQGPDHIARLIAGIERDHAIAATPNGEAIEVNPDSGRLRIVPVTDLPADIGTYARRKIRKAVDLFDETPGNQYAALRDDLRLLRDATDDPDSTPVELFDACASASRRLTQRIRNAECPTGEQDPVIADYATRIREAGADILGNDPKTQEMLSARNAITGNNALIEGGAVIRAASDLIVGGTEGLLAKALPRDAAVATDPKADPEDRKVASFRTASRLLRIGKVIATPVAWVGGTTIGVAAVIQAVPVILRFLGF